MTWPCAHPLASWPGRTSSRVSLPTVPASTAPARAGAAVPPDTVTGMAAPPGAENLSLPAIPGIRLASLLLTTIIVSPTEDEVHYGAARPRHVP